MKKSVLLSVSFLFIIQFSFGQILTFDFNGLVGNEVSANSNSNDANLSSSTITRGSGLTASANGDRFNATQWTTTNAVGDAVTNNDYFEFTITPNSGFEFSVTSIDFNFQRSGTGPKAFTLRSSVDSYASDLASATLTDNTSIQSRTFTFSLSNQNAAVTFRLYGYDAEGTSGTGGLEGTGNDLEVVGTVAASCTAPSTQASNFGSASVMDNSMTVSWTRGDGDAGVIVVAKAGGAVDTDPMNGTGYTGNASFGSGDEIGTGNFVVYQGTGTNVPVTNLMANTAYHFAIYEYNATGTCYNQTELTGNATTTCSTPLDVSGVVASVSNMQIPLSWSNSTCFDEVLVVASTASVTGTPMSTDGSHYTANAIYASGSATQDFSSPEFPVYKGTGTSMLVTGLTNSTPYFFKIFTRKGTSWSAGVEVTATPIAGPFYTEDFDDNTGAVTITYSEQCNDNLGDYFGAVCLDGGTCGNTIGSFITYSGGDGGTFLGAMDTDGTPCTSSTETVTFNDINIAGASTIYLCFEVAEDESSDGAEDWDANDKVVFEVDFDNAGSFGEVLQISASGSTNSEPGIDTDCDENQDGTTMSSTFTTYCVGILGTGTTMDLRVRISGLTAGDEDIAIDNIRLYDGSANLPETPITATCAQSLPVELVKFTATEIDGTVELNWQTLSEINNSHFEVEHSLDGENFEQVEEIKGQGTIAVPIYYSYIHKKAVAGTNYYRLRQVDFDGTFEYSDVISVELSKHNNDIKMFPNPASTSLNIQIPTFWTGETMIEIFDLAGRLIDNQIITNNTTVFDLSNRTNGQYIIRVTNASTVITKHFVKNN